MNEITKFSILDEKQKWQFWMKIRNFDEILDKIGDFRRTKNGILDKIFLVSQNMPVAQYKISADTKNTVNFS